MILADTPLWLSISINLLLVVQVVVSVLLVGIVLMQRPKQEGLGAAFGAGMTDQMFGARTTSVLQRGTVYLGVAFFVLALALAVLIGQRSKYTHKSLLSDVKNPPAPAAPAVPASMSEQIKKAEEAAKAAEASKAPATGDQPAAPTTPQPGAPATQEKPAEAPAQPQPQPEAPAAQPEAPAAQPEAPAQAPAGGGQ